MTLNERDFSARVIINKEKGDNNKLFKPFAGQKLTQEKIKISKCSVLAKDQRMGNLLFLIRAVLLKVKSYLHDAIHLLSSLS